MELRQGCLPKTLLTMALTLMITFGDASLGQSQTNSETDAHAGMLIDGGALPFIYGSGLWSLVTNYGIEPPSSPRLFGSSEGGSAYKGDTIPEWMMMGAGIGGLAGVVLSGKESRWFHVKGIVQAMLTSSALTGSAKVVFGRHRPHYDMGNRDPEHRKSFFSGHSSQSFALATYGMLFLRGHVFSDVDNNGGTQWLELLTYGALLGVASVVPYTRIADNRHHPTDVVAGAAVGTGLSWLFYRWQEKRYRVARDGGDSARWSFKLLSSRPFMLQGTCVF